MLDSITACAEVADDEASSSHLRPEAWENGSDVMESLSSDVSPVPGSFRGNGHSQDSWNVSVALLKLFFIQTVLCFA